MLERYIRTLNYLNVPTFVSCLLACNPERLRFYHHGESVITYVQRKMLEKVWHFDWFPFSDTNRHKRREWQRLCYVDCVS